MRRMFTGIMLLLTAGLALAQQPFVHPTLNGLRLLDGAITIDGQDEDWLRIGAPLAEYRKTTDDITRWSFGNPERGDRTGAADASFTATVASDAKYLYVLVDVHDQLLINDGTAETPFFGDDFEIFIDANPPETRFTKTNENVRQLIFLPAYLNPAFPQPLIWQAEKNPGVVAAGRFRPWGYTLEVKVPKALFPNWQAHPEMATIGFDACINDADASGVDAIHPAIKGALFLSTAGTHFMSPEKLSTLQFGEKPVKLKSGSRFTGLSRKVNTNDPQAVLDAIDSRQAAKIAAKAIASDVPAARKAGLLLLAKRPELPAPVPALLDIIKEPAVEGVLGTPDLRTYALIALAQRKQLPAGQVFDMYGNYTADPALRITALWALGINGDKAVTPQLIGLLKDKNLRARMMAAMALGNLHDATALEPLAAMAKDDAHQYARIQAEKSIAQIKEGK